MTSQAPSKKNKIPLVNKTVKERIQKFDCTVRKLYGNQTEHKLRVDSVFYQKLESLYDSDEFQAMREIYSLGQHISNERTLVRYLCAAYCEPTFLLDDVESSCIGQTTGKKARKSAPAEREDGMVASDTEPDVDANDVATQTFSLYVDNDDEECEEEEEEEISVF